MMLHRILLVLTTTDARDCWPGEPNPARQDHCAYEFTQPETAYSDTSSAYASNEIAINWNVPLVYLSGALGALQKRVGYVKK